MTPPCGDKQREYKHNKQFFQKWTNISFCSTTPPRRIGGYVLNTSMQFATIMTRRTPMTMAHGSI